MLCNADISLYNALLGYFFVLNIDLKQDRAYKLPLRRLFSSSNEVKECIEQEACDFALPQALIFTDFGNLTQLQLDEFDQILEIVLTLAVLNVRAFGLYVLGKHKARLSKRHWQLYILRSLRVACQVSSLVRHLGKFKLHFAVIYYAFEDLKE